MHWERPWDSGEGPLPCSLPTPSLSSRRERGTAEPAVEGRVGSRAAASVPATAWLCFLDPPRLRRPLPVSNVVGDTHTPARLCTRCAPLPTSAESRAGSPTATTQRRKTTRQDDPVSRVETLATDILHACMWVRFREGEWALLVLLPTASIRTWDFQHMWIPRQDAHAWSPRASRGERD